MCRCFSFLLYQVQVLCETLYDWQCDDVIIGKANEMKITSSYIRCVEYIKVTTARRDCKLFIMLTDDRPTKR